MAKYRSVQVSFWQDSFVLDLTPEEKYFYLYLMTNSKASQCGIYELPIKLIEMETGYNRETVGKLLQRFIDYGKVSYNDQNNEIMIVNWIRHNWNPSIKVISRVNSELKEVKTTEFVEQYLQQALEIEDDPSKTNQLYRIDTLSIQYRYKEKEKEKEKDKEKEKQYPAAAQTYYENHIGMIKPIILEDLQFYGEKFIEADEIIKRAIDIAISRSAKNWGYVKAILRGWQQEGLETLEQVDDHEKGDNKNQERSFSIDDL